MKDLQIERCEEVLKACDAALFEADIMINKLDESSKTCNGLVDTQNNLIQEDKKQIEDLAARADHSHVPHVLGTSAIWVLLIILL